MKQNTSRKRLVMAAVFIVYLYMLVKLILFKGGSVDLRFLLVQLEHSLQYRDRIFDHPGNFTPFKEISREIHNLSHSNASSSINLIGNILAFIPLGIFLPKLLTLRGASFVKVSLLSLGLSLCFEVTQLLLFIGTFDVDDLILNTFGGMMGYFIWRLFVSMRKFQLLV